jgi:hypothetical protein
MFNLVPTGRTYNPAIVAVMTTAFESVSQTISNGLHDDEAKERLALVILRHVDRGEDDPEKLADLALQEWRGAHRLPIPEFG